MSRQINRQALIALLLLSTAYIPNASAVQQHPTATAADNGACTPNAQVAAFDPHYNDVCDSNLNQHTMRNPASYTSGDLHQQLQAQQLMLKVLSNITAKVITAEAAFALLHDLAALRSSLAQGAAAERWAKMRAKSTWATQQRNHIHQDSRDPPQQPQPSCNPQDEGAHNSAEQDTGEIAPSRGILIVAGGLHQLMNVYVLLQLLRHPIIGCSLPVEVVYYGKQEYEGKAVGLILSHAKATGTLVTFIDGYAAAPTTLEPHKPAAHLTGFKTKVHALAFITSFDQVLMLDSDNTPLVDPTYLFSSESFKRTGNIQWLDFWRNQWMKPVLYNLLGLEVPWEVNTRFRASEAGQLVIDRVRHYDVLEWLWLLNMHSSSGVAGSKNSGVVGECIWGDKDTYPIAFQLAGKGHLINNIQHHPLQALSKPGAVYMHAGMVQRGVFGELLFLHRTAAGKLWPHCVVHSMVTCQVWGVTTPVDQDQLVISVQDVTAMQYDSRKIDLEWQERHCGTGKSAGAPVNSTSEQQQQQHNATMISCNLDKGVGLLPIPAVAAKFLPHQVQQMLNLTYEIFVQSVMQVRSLSAVSAPGTQQSTDPYDDPSDPYK